jgi:hypothetical protein
VSRITKAKVRKEAKKKQEKRHRLLFAAAFGANYTVVDQLSKLFETEFGHSTFFYYEFFLERPFTYWDNLETAFKRHQQVSAPFLARIAQNQKFVPDIDELVGKIETKIRKNEPLENLVFPLSTGTPKDYLSTLYLDIGSLDVLQLLSLFWQTADNGKQINGYYIKKFKAAKRVPGYLEFDSSDVIKQDGIVALTADINLEYWQKIYLKEVLQKAAAIIDSQERKGVIRSILLEYGLVMDPWLRSIHQNKVMKTIVVSLSSDAVFWGEFILMFPEMKQNIERRVLEKIVGELRDYVAKSYVPMLTLFENFLCESDMAAAIKNTIKNKSLPDLGSLVDSLWFNQICGHAPNTKWFAKNSQQLRSAGTGSSSRLTNITPKFSLKTNKWQEVKYDNVFLSLMYHADRRPKSGERINNLERTLMELWADRFGSYPDKKKEVSESLIFAKYLVASPEMTKLVLEAAKLRHFKEEENPNLVSDDSAKVSVKTALVIGGPGSGKDQMAELITLFSPGFRLGRVDKINMAVFRPKEAAVPLLLGVEAELGSPTTKFGLSGYLWRMLSAGQTRNPDDRGGTFIFDELNSLDIDTQGALLRFIENGDLKPLGGLKGPRADPPTNDTFNVLIVGVMNEDPQTIMKRRVMDEVLRDKELFGGMLGEFLYEMFRTQRRLRDDLYYRFIRGGEIVLPELRNRRGDLPILFYFQVDGYKRLMPDLEEWEVDISAYEHLMDPSLKWEGNLRELQAVARQAVIIAHEAYKRTRQQGEFRIMGTHVRAALEGVLRLRLN